MITSLEKNEIIELYMWKRVMPNHKITVKSSKPSVVSVRNESGNFITLTPKKQGNTKITIRNKTTKKKYTCTVTYMKYTNPFKTFKIGKHNVKKKMNASKVDVAGNYSDPDTGRADIFGYTGAISGNSKIKVTAKKGWKVKKIQYQALHSSGGEDFDRTIKKTIKNNSKIKIKKSRSWWQVLNITMYNKKYDATMVFKATIRDER